MFSHGYQVKNIVRQLGLSSSVAVTTLAGDPDRLESLARALAPIGGFGGHLPAMLLASKLVFAAMAASVILVGAAVLGQRTFR